MSILLITIAMLFGSTGQVVEYRDAMVEQAEEIALEAGCGSSTRCRSLRATELIATARSLTNACLDEGWLPAEWCLFPVANLGESHANPYPTLASSACNRKCGREPNGESRSCRVRCERKRRGPTAARLAKRANDSGTSHGWFQIKSGQSLHRWCEDMLGEFSPHDLLPSARCISARVRFVAEHKRPCGKDDNWSVAIARVTAGPFLRVRETNGVPGSKRVKRCHGNGYAEEARRGFLRAKEQKVAMATNPKPIPGRLCTCAGWIQECKDE